MIEEIWWSLDRGRVIPKVGLVALLGTHHFKPFSQIMQKQ